MGWSMHVTVVRDQGAARRDLASPGEHHLAGLEQVLGLLVAAVAEALLDLHVCSAPCTEHSMRQGCHAVLSIGKLPSCNFMHGVMSFAAAMSMKAAKNTSVAARSL